MGDIPKDNDKNDRHSTKCDSDDKHDSDNNVDDRRQEEFYKLLAKHNMLPPPGWVKSKLKGREHANSVTLV